MRRMLTDKELRDLRTEAMRYPECIECRTILRLVEEVERLADELDHWIKRATFAEQFVPAQGK